jgi:hypothetical protein
MTLEASQHSLEVADALAYNPSAMRTLSLFDAQFADAGVVLSYGALVSFNAKFGHCL